MAGADLDAVIRQIAKQNSKNLIAAAKTRRDHFARLAAGAKGAEAKARYKELAKQALALGTAAAQRLQVAADNAADSYARSMRNALAAPPPKVEKPAKKADGAAPAKKAVGKKAAAKKAVKKKA
jgi:hypothetical protein